MTPTSMPNLSHLEFQQQQEIARLRQALREIAVAAGDGAALGEIQAAARAAVRGGKP